MLSVASTLFAQARPEVLRAPRRAMPFTNQRAPAAICVGPTHPNRCQAIQDLVRPEEVHHLWRDISCAGGAHQLVCSMSAWWKREWNRTLRYIPDPIDCDLWGSPARTLRVGGGDCDDLAITALSMLLLGGVDAFVVAGEYLNEGRRTGHAWVEGNDDDGWFLFEATSGLHYRKVRPREYSPKSYLRPGLCIPA